jgi:hypothetical protein
MGQLLAPVLAVAVVVGSVVPSVLAQSGDLWVGQWKLNLPKSTYSPGPPPTVKSQIITHEAVPNGIRTIIEAVDAMGATSRREITVLFDGKEYEVEGGPRPATRVYRRIDNRSYEYVERVNGQVRVTMRVGISADGKIRTNTTTGVGGQGQRVHNIEGSERQ